MIPKEAKTPALLQMARATHALVLRDIKTRFGRSYFGFLLGLLIPLVHIVIVLTVYIIVGRRAPIGTDVRLFLATAILPFVVWSYTHQKMVRCLPENRPLLSFPVINITDIALARAIVELLNSTLLVIVAVTALSIWGVDTFVIDIKAAFFSFVLAYLLGVSTGLVFSCIALVSPGFMLVGFLIIPLYWATAGVFFIPGALPEMIREPLSLFPMAHIVDLLREAIYPNYVSDFPSIWYVATIIVGNILIFMLATTFGKAALTTR